MAPTPAALHRAHAFLNHTIAAAGMEDDAHLNMLHLSTITLDSPLAATFVDFVHFFKVCLGHRNARRAPLFTLLRPFHEEHPSSTVVQHEWPLTLMRTVLAVLRPYTPLGYKPPALPDLAALLSSPAPRSPPDPPAGQAVLSTVGVASRAGSVVGCRVGGVAVAAAADALGCSAGSSAGGVHSSDGGVAAAPLQAGPPPASPVGDLANATWDDPDYCVLPNLADIPSSYGTSTFSSDSDDDGPNAALLGFEPAHPPGAPPAACGQGSGALLGCCCHE
jgi:hypothetical protein